MIVALLMVFAMMPMTAGTVFAIDADITPPEIDVSSLQVTLPEGKTEGTVQVTSAAGRTVVYTKAPNKKSVTVPVKVGNKAQNKIFIKRYKKIFTEANAGKKAKVK